MNYMRNQPTPSVVYQQRPMNLEPVHYGEASSSSQTNNYDDYQNPSFHSYQTNYGEFFGSLHHHQYGRISISSHPPVIQPDASFTDSKAPEVSSGWDFFNPFESFESYYPPYTPREEEGIPDLEDEGESYQQQEVVKEVEGNQKVVDTGGDEKSPVVDETDLPTTVVAEEEEEAPVEYDVHVVVDEEKPLLNDSEIINQIHTQFDLASQSGNHLAKIAEVGKLPHNRKHAVYQVPSKMLKVFTPPADTAIVEMDVDLFAKSKNLSSTLHKLYLWEKKLLAEVKIEEKMRLLHVEKKQRLVRMDEKGAEPHKVDATRALVRSLSTKIRIAIKVVDKISEKINNLRDEELWPQLNDFIQGLTRMWRSMLECHHNQHEAIRTTKRIDNISSYKHSSAASLAATLQLEHELLNWAIRFSCWFGAQKGFVKALNSWLLKCLMHEPEQTVDGPVPFSPGRIGAPAIFIICNQWAQSMEAISDKEVVHALRSFATTVMELWERDKVLGDRNQVRNLDKEDQKVQKELQRLDKMIVFATGSDDNRMSLGHAVYQSETSKNVSLQMSLQRVFESFERFAATSLKAYEELLQRVEDDDLAG